MLFMKHCWIFFSDLEILGLFKIDTNWAYVWVKQSQKGPRGGASATIYLVIRHKICWGLTGHCGRHPNRDLFPYYSSTPSNKPSAFPPFRGSWRLTTKLFGFDRSTTVFTRTLWNMAFNGIVCMLNRSKDHN